MANIKDLKRMCNYYYGKVQKCYNCPLYDTDCSSSCFPDNADEIVDKWVQEHPVKTYAMDFFEKFPNAPRDRDGAPKTCWKHVYGDGKYCSSDACTECWNREMKEDG